MSTTTRGYLIGLAVAVALIIVGVAVFLVLQPSGDGNDDLRDRQAACIAEERPLAECMSISD